MRPGNPQVAAPPDPRQQNMNIRQLLLRQGVDMFQQIGQISQNPNVANIYTFNPMNVGLIRGFLVKVTGTLHNNDAGVQATRTELGASNLISSITLNDFNNTQRINTTGWHNHLVNSAKQPLVFGGAYAPNVPVDYGVNWTVQSAPANIAAAADAAVSFYWYVPYAYSKTDLRGAVWAGQVSATAQLQITLNVAGIGVNAGDPTLAAYSGSNVVVWKAATNAVVTVWQDYIDQVPIAQTKNGPQPVLPPLDISQMYELRNTIAAGVPVVGQQFLMPYTNLRNFLSTALIFDNGGNLNAGNDVTQFSINAANTTALLQVGPNEAALMARSIFAADLPKGCYWFSHRNKPVNTIQFGNITLQMQASVVNANAQVLLGYEDFGQLDQVSLATAVGVNA